MAELRNTPVQGRSVETLERVLASAEHLLNTDRPEKITTRQIAEQAGVSVGSVYRLFPDKSAIIRAVVDRYLHEWASEVTPDAPTELSTDPDQIDALVRTFIYRSVSLLDKHPGWRRLRNWHYEDTGELVREPVFAAQVATVAAVIRGAVPTIDPETAELIGTFVCEISWPLLDRVPTGAKRDVAVEEIVFLVRTYVIARLAAE